MGSLKPLNPRNRYADTRRNPDWTIDQNWASYSPEEHGRWNRLFARQASCYRTAPAKPFWRPRPGSNCPAQASPISRICPVASPA